MIQELTTYEVADLLLADPNANWTRNGALALAEHLEQLELDLGEPISFCRVAIRCHWSEYASTIEAAKEFGGFYDNPDEGSSNGHPPSCEFCALDYLQDKTTVIEFDGGIIVANA